MAKGSKSGIWIGITAMTIAMFGAVWATRQALFEAAGQILVRDDALVGRSSGVYLLLGDRSGMRGYRVLEILKSGLVERIVFGTDEKRGLETEGFAPNDAEVHAALYRARGVPDEQLTILPCLVKSTKDEAECFLAHARSQGEASHIYVVTSWYHTSRAAWIFDRVFADSGITPVMLASALPEHSPDNWWRYEASFLSVFSEYLKWTYYLLHY